MARPERNNIDYFPFICEEGNKMFYIEETWGNDGFAVFVKLLRELAKTDYHYLNLSKPSTVMFLSAKCKVSKEVLESIISDLVDLGKFNEMLWKENKIVWCQDFIDNIQDAYIKRKNKCINLPSLLLLLESLGIRKPSKLPPKGGRNPQSIVKETKEEENKRKYEERKLKFSSTLAPFLETYGKDLLNDFYRYWTEPNQTGTKFRKEMEKTWDIERRLESWAKRDKDFNKTQDGTKQQPAGTKKQFRFSTESALETLARKNEGGFSED